MIKSITFNNFRNLNEKYSFGGNFNCIVGKNNSGKSNILDGIKLAFSTINGDYFKISKSDFYDSDDSKVITIDVELEKDSIPSLNYGNNECGFKVTIYKNSRGKYLRTVSLLSGSNIDMDVLHNDPKIPNIYNIPLLRIEDIYNDNLVSDISKFIESEESYQQMTNEIQEKAKKTIETKSTKFSDFCKKFDQNMNVELSSPELKNEKVYIVDGDGKKEHNYKIGSGYKSIANIILNTLDDNYNIILIDEIENHLHPSLIRTLIRELRNVENTFIICTTHSAVVINELKTEEIIDVSGKSLKDIDSEDLNKLNIFLHPGRSELILADNVILVEGYTEELLLNNYLVNNNFNWTVVNVGGVMFKPYIILATFLGKKVVVISDDDKSLNKDDSPTKRFLNLKSLCNKLGIKLIEMQNTLESDLYINDLIIDKNMLTEKGKYYVAKPHKKTEIAEKIIENNINNLSEWHVIKEIKDEFKNN